MCQNLTKNKKLGVVIRYVAAAAAAISPDVAAPPPAAAAAAAAAGKKPLGEEDGRKLNRQERRAMVTSGNICVSTRHQNGLNSLANDLSLSFVRIYKLNVFLSPRIFVLQWIINRSYFGVDFDL